MCLSPVRDRRSLYANICVVNSRSDSRSDSDSRHGRAVQSIGSKKMVSVQSWPIASKVKDSAARTMSPSKKMERSLHHARSGHRLERSAEDAAREASRLNSRPAAETYRCKWLIANFSRFREDFAKSPGAFLLNSQQFPLLSSGWLFALKPWSLTHWSLWSFSWS